MIVVQDANTKEEIAFVITKKTVFNKINIYQVVTLETLSNFLGNHIDVDLEISGEKVQYQGKVSPNHYTANEITITKYKYNKMVK